jgi:DNA-binding transcriptional ArsR family regulator
MHPATKSESKLKSKIFNALADPTRLEILEFLRNGEKCVCEIIPHLGLIQPIVSRHLKILKDSGIVKDRKEGNKRFYSLTDARICIVIDVITPELSDSLTKQMIKQIA